MPELDPQRLEVVRAVKAQIGQEDVLTPIQARAFVRGLQTAWDVPPIQWSSQESRSQLIDAKRLLQAASIFLNIEGDESTNATQCYRRAGEILEWLSRANDTVASFVPIELLSAAAYQMGKLPAMAAALLQQAELSGKGVKLYAHFLRGNFDGVLRATAGFWKDNPEATVATASASILTASGNDKISWFLTVELVRILGVAADALRSGNNARLESVKAKFSALRKLALRTTSEEATLLLELMFQITSAFERSSIYQPIRQLAALKQEKARRLEKFARTQFSRGRGILWTSQLHGISRLLQQSSFALCTPTGSGKTLVANLALIKELLLRDVVAMAPLALYIVPSRALANEVEGKLADELGNDFIVTGLYGGNDWGVTDYWINASQPTVLVATVEKADALMRYLSHLILARLTLLIVDEAHQVVPEDNERTLADLAEHSNRSIRLEAFVSRLLAKKPNVVRIALTAVAGGASGPVAKWIEGNTTAEAVGVNYRSTRQIIGELETSPGNAGRMRLEFINGRPLYVRGRDEPVYLRLRTPPMPSLPAKMRSSIYRFNELDILWTALHLIKDGRRILISVAQEPEQTMGWYVQALDLEEWTSVTSFVPPRTGKNAALFKETLETCNDYCGANSFEVTLLKKGIASNHGQMPQRLRRLMTKVIDAGICPITVATATLTEGVNLPFDIIFLSSLKRRSFDPLNDRPIVTPMTLSEFSNLSGRAGRPGASNGMEGITLVAIPTRPAATAPKVVPKQRRQIAELRADYANLRTELAAAGQLRDHVESPLALLLHSIAKKARELLDLEDDDFIEWLETAAPSDIDEDAGQAATSETARLADSLDELDGILLAATEELEELSGATMQSAEIEAALIALWQRTFTSYAAQQEAWLERAFIKRGLGVVTELYPNRADRTKFYQYGFTPFVGQRFDGVAPQLKELIAGAQNYGIETPEQRLQYFEQLGSLIKADRGYGFRIRDTVTDQRLLADWEGVLAWWMRAPGANHPTPDNLRSWQRFVSDNVEFRLGVAVGAVTARAWADGVIDASVVPSLDIWRATTGLPWFGFWARELLRWGTLDPFVAFALAQGHAGTRDAASAKRTEFDGWLEANHEDIAADDCIDPRLFLEWEKAIPQRESERSSSNDLVAELRGTDGARGRYRVIPVDDGDTIRWMDSAGYELARSARGEFILPRRFERNDYELLVIGRRVSVQRTFGGRD